MVRFLIFLIIIFGFSFQAMSGASPSELQLVLDALKNNNNTLIYLDEIPKDAEEFYWRNTRRRDDGTLEIINDEGYQKLIKEMKKNVLPASAKKINSFIKIEGINFAGVLKESKYRTSLFFVSPLRRENIMLTVWDFSEEGARMVLMRPFFNIKINGMPGTMAIVVAINKNSGKMWKVTWVVGGRQYELYVEDGYLEQWDKYSILKLAESVK